MSYRFEASETFWRNFYRLPDRKKAAVRRAWEIFNISAVQRPMPRTAVSVSTIESSSMRLKWRRVGTLPS